jgi:hypothetical protein
VDIRIYLSTLIYFIDYLLQLSQELSQKLRNEIIQLKEAKKMWYLDQKNPPPTLAEWEEIFKKEGRAEGIEENQKQVALELLKDGFPIEMVSKYVKLPIIEIERLQKCLLNQ